MSRTIRSIEHRKCHRITKYSDKNMSLHLDNIQKFHYLSRRLTTQSVRSISKLLKKGNL